MSGRLKSSELRIGNYIAIGDLVQKVHAILSDNMLRTIGTKGGHSYLPISRYRKIRLTESNLPQMGFKKQKGQDDDGMLWRNQHFWLRRSWKLKTYILYYSDSNDDWYYTTTVKVRYVHELQNLVFAMRKKELL